MEILYNQKQKIIIMKKIMFIAVIAMAFLSSCTSLKTTMKEPNVSFELYADNVYLSDQVSAEVTSTKIVGIDWSRLFDKTSGVIESPAISLASIPVVGNYMTNTTANIALFELMDKNKGYDVVFYPQYSTKIDKPFGMGLFYRIETVSVTSRLGKLK